MRATPPSYGRNVPIANRAEQHSTYWAALRRSAAFREGYSRRGTTGRIHGDRFPLLVEVDLLRRFVSGWILTGILGAVLGFAVVLGIDLLQPAPVTADVIEVTETPAAFGEVAVVSWVDADGVAQTVDVVIPHEFAGLSQVPLYVTQAPYVSNGWLPLYWYLFAVVAGFLLGRLATTSIFRQPYAETPVRQVVRGAGV